MSHLVRVVSLLLMSSIVLFFSSDSVEASSVSDCVNGEDCEQVKRAEVESEEGREETSVGPTFGSYVKLFFAFAFVIVLLYATLRFVNRRNFQMSQHRLMRNLGGVSVGSQRSIQLISVGGTYYLVGVGEDVRLLKEVTDEKEIEQIKKYVQEEQEGALTAPSFLAVDSLRSLFNKKKERDVTDAPKEEARFDHLFQEELERVQEERKEKVAQVIEEERDRHE